MKVGIALIITATVALFSCEQVSRSTPEISKTETINSERRYEYTDSKGKGLIIENGGPKGDTYTDPNGKKYFKALFWTRLINETDTPLEFRVGFPAASYELPSSPGISFKILLPSDTMEVDEMSSYNYGLSGLKSFLDSSIDKPSSLKRTINPSDSGGFYVVILRLLGTEGPSGILRTGLSLKGQNLFYRISRYDSAPAHALVDEKEIDCGSINLKNLVLQK